MVLGCFFQEPDEPPPAFREGAISMGMVPGVTTWLARVEGQPAGGGSLMIHDRLALICGDGTLPRFRHRGVQTELLRARLSHAQARRLQARGDLHAARQRLPAQCRAAGLSHGLRPDDAGPTLRKGRGACLETKATRQGYRERRALEARVAELERALVAAGVPLPGTDEPSLPDHPPEAAEGSPPDCSSSSRPCEWWPRKAGEQGGRCGLHPSEGSG